MTDGQPSEDTIDELWAAGKFSEALAMGIDLASDRPSDAAFREKLALLAIDYARQSPVENQIVVALEWLNQALAIEPDRRSSLELRGNLLLVMAHNSVKIGLDSEPIFRQAAQDFLQLLVSLGGEEHEKKSVWQIEAARAAFLAEKNRSEGAPDYELAAALFALADQESYDASDWFFRGMSNLELGEKSLDEGRLRVAGASFLRSLEEDAFAMEGRYFAAHALLLLDDPSEQEFELAQLMVQELDASPNKEFLIDALKERLILRAKLTGRPQPEL